MRAAPERGRPSFVWRFGQERRFQMLVPFLPANPEPVLDIGCGVGVYMQRFREEALRAFGIDVEMSHLRAAARDGLPVACALAEQLPFPDATFGTVLLHEVLEHFACDRLALQEALRVTRPGGRLFIFVPNRLYPFETHGIYLGRRYVFGNIPFVPYLPAPLRRRLCPHVRSYTGASLRRLCQGLCCRTVHHVRIYPGYDKIWRRWPRVAGAVRSLAYLAERTPLQLFGLSHFLVLERLAAP